MSCCVDKSLSPPCGLQVALSFCFIKDLVCARQPSAFGADYGGRVRSEIREGRTACAAARGSRIFLCFCSRPRFLLQLRVSQRLSLSKGGPSTLRSAMGLAVAMTPMRAPWPDILVVS